MLTQATRSALKPLIKACLLSFFMVFNTLSSQLSLVTRLCVTPRRVSAVQVLSSSLWLRQGRSHLTASSFLEAQKLQVAFGKLETKKLWFFLTVLRGFKKTLSNMLRRSPLQQVNCNVPHLVKHRQLLFQDRKFWSKKSAEKCLPFDIFQPSDKKNFLQPLPTCGRHHKRITGPVFSLLIYNQISSLESLSDSEDSSSSLPPRRPF